MFDNGEDCLNNIITVIWPVIWLLTGVIPNVPISVLEISYYGMHCEGIHSFTLFLQVITDHLYYFIS